jgi:hypothetical protein
MKNTILRAKRELEKNPTNDIAEKKRKNANDLCT